MTAPATQAARAVAYLRMSSDKQERSVEGQRAEVEKYAARHGYRIVREYVDEGISGDATEKRAAFRQMLRDAAERGDFRAVLCWDQDRFGRFDPLEAGYWVKPLRDAGVYLETVAQGRIDWEDFAGRIIYAVQQEGKHAFLVDMSRTSTRGSLAAARRGQWLGGATPYGFRLESKRLAPGDPEQIAVVLWLFRTYAEDDDASLGELARRLNERGVRGPGGKMWHKTTIQKLLDNPLYAGDMVWNRRHEGKYHAVRGGEIVAERNRAGLSYHTRDNWVIVSNAHEALVPRDLWDRVRRKRVEKKPPRTPHRDRGRFLLTGLLVCKGCGGPMHGCVNVNRDRDRKGRLRSDRIRTYRLYICGRYNQHGKAGCRCNTVQEKRVVAALVRKLCDDFLDPANLARLREELTRRLEARRQGDPADAGRLRRRVADLERKVDQGTEGYLEAPRHLRPGLAAKLDQWKQELDAARSDLDAALRETAPAGPTVEQALAQLGKLREQFQAADPAKLRAVFRQMVSRVELWFDHVPYGKTRKGEPRERSVVARGLVHLRPDLVVNRDVHSGLARGVDAAAHRAALEAGGRTLAVLANGLATVYPPEHKELAGQVAAAGAVLSESPMGQAPDRGLFPARNRIISGLSRLVVVVEAGERSGALLTAGHAAEQGRTVMAVPGPVDSEASAGCHALIRDGAVLVRGVDDVLEELHGVSATSAPASGAAAAPAPAAAPAGPPPGLDETQRRVWDFLAGGPRHLDEMAQQLGAPVPALSTALLMMEMKKAVRRLPGNRYERPG
jgi:DNA protecting protein DprA